MSRVKCLPSFYWFEFSRYGIRYMLSLISVSIFCMFSLLFVSVPDTYESYDTALSAVFALSCACVLLGLMMSISMIYEEYPALRIDLGMGVPAVYVIKSKIIVILVLGFVMSLVLSSPYIMGFYQIPDLKIAYLVSAVFITIVTVASFSLLISTICRYHPKIAMFVVIIYTLYQILFSGFIFRDNILGFLSIRVTSVSNWSIYAIGGALRFDNPKIHEDSSLLGDHFLSDPGSGIYYLGVPAIFSILCFLLCIFILSSVSKTDPSPRNS